MSENGFYVYTLIDPRDFSVYYVGKGQGRRIERHFDKYRLEKVISNPHKSNKIKSLKKKGYTPKNCKSVVVSELYNNKAYELEEFIIKEIGRENLTNCNLGKKGRIGQTSVGLTKDDVAEIRWLIKNTNLTASQIGNIFDYSESVIKMIREERSWAYVDPVRPVMPLPKRKKYQKDIKRNGSVLEEKDVAEIRWLTNKNKHSHSFLADIYDTSTSVVSQIAARQSWKDVPPEKPKKIPEPNKVTLNRWAKSEIKWLALNSDMTQEEIGSVYGVDQGYVSNLKNGNLYSEADPKMPHLSHRL